MVAQCDPCRIQPCTMQAQGGLHIHRPDLNYRITLIVSMGSQVWSKVEGPKLVLTFLLAESEHHRAKDSTRVHFLSSVLPSKRTACINGSPCLALSNPNCLSELLKATQGGLGFNPLNTGRRRTLLRPRLYACMCVVLVV